MKPFRYKFQANCIPNSSPLLTPAKIHSFLLALSRALEAERIDKRRDIHSGVNGRQAGSMDTSCTEDVEESCIFRDFNNECLGTLKGSSVGIRNS